MRRILGLSLVVLLTLGTLAVWGWPWIWWRFNWEPLRGYQPYILGLPITALAIGGWALALSSEPRRRYLSVRFLAVGVSVILSWAAVEACSIALEMQRKRARNRFPNVKEAVYDETFGHVHKPHMSFTATPYEGRLPGFKEVTFTANRHGFRVDDDLLEARVVMVGDSFVEGTETPNEETFVSLLGECLSEPVANLGRAGYGPQQELLVMERYAFDYKPDTIVWVLWEGNDLADAFAFDLFVKNPKEPKTNFLAKAWGSALIRRVWNSHRRGGLTPIIGTFTSSDGAEHPIEFILPYSQNIDDQQNSWELVHDALKRGVDLCRERGVRLVIGVLPTKYRVLGPLCRFDEAGQNAPFEEGTSRSSKAVVDLAGAVEQFCDQNQVAFVDLSTSLIERAEAGDIPYHTLVDVHLSPLGHRAVAASLCRFLKAGSEESGPDADESTRGSSPVDP